MAINPNLDPKAAVAYLHSGAGKAHGVNNSMVRGGPGRSFGSPGNRGAVARGVASHHTDVPHSGGGHGGNPNHDEHGRFT